MIHDLGPRLILAVGIAGGVPHDEFTLGDVIVSTRIHTLDVGARHEDGSSTFAIRGGIHPAISDSDGSLLLYAVKSEADVGMVKWMRASCRR